ncbi:hypothetical protein YDYSY3_02750 [Paenibacillus chitinolyticus]|uniref:hypothetical protein n=1 Tax=Paenibacillus chitinolyticus TaxID=79263 RepID=UPI0026E4C826|nr:hypothetical protein [Paenibacillus chitinolyticus]GKS09275.1 hypothetical protein YDYSY3_02750 [Paenibacillus chitinolyticus]
MIINGVSVGPYELGWGLQELKEKISISGFVEEELDNHYTITTNTLKFWVEKEQGEITQITVFGEYEGKFLGKIGVGNRLSDLNDLNIKWIKEDYVYKLSDYPGICFESEDIDDWDELLAPIEFISIYCS